MLQQIKELYRRFDTGIMRLKGKLRSHDEQLDQLHAAVAALAVDGVRDIEQRQAARRRLEEMFAHRAAVREEYERLLALYESTALRVAAAEAEISHLRERLDALEAASSRQAGERR